MDLSDKEFNQLMNEIDNDQNKKATHVINDNVDWNEIMNKIRAKDTNFVKNAIASKDIEINAQNPQNGKTLLMYAVIIGDFDLVKNICNNGADVSIKDKEGMDALDYALNFGRYKITELVFYRQLSGKTGNDLKRISTEIHTKNKEAEFIQSQRVKSKYDDCETYKAITQFMIAAIKERAPFDV